MLSYTVEHKYLSEDALADDTAVTLTACHNVWESSVSKVNIVAPELYDISNRNEEVKE